MRHVVIYGEASPLLEAPGSVTLRLVGLLGAVLELLEGEVRLDARRAEAMSLRLAPGGDLHIRWSVGDGDQLVLRLVAHGARAEGG